VEESNTKKDKLKDKKEKKKHHPDRPKYPISGYFRFNQENLEKIKKEYPEMAQKELVTLSSILWNKLSDEEKKPYEEAFEKDKKVYNIAI
jgi:upstream-binding transcription factor